MKNKFSKLILGMSIAASLTGCVKDDYKDQGSAGDTIIKFVDGGSAPKVIALEYKEGAQRIIALDVRRDANSNANLNKEVSITIKNTQAYLDAYNTEHDTQFELMPSDVYTIVSNPYLTVSGDTWTVKLPAGVFATEIQVDVDATKFDLTKSYAFGVKAEQTTVGKVSGETSEALVNVLIKNQYHGSYHASGTFNHPVNGPRPIDEDKELVTSGATSVVAPLGDLGGSGYYMNLTINPDNSVTVEPRGATPNIRVEGANTYDPVAKSFTLNYSYNLTAPRVVTETITMK